MRNEPSAKVNKPSAPPPTPAFNAKKEAKVLSSPTGNLNSNTISINQLVEMHQQNRAVRNEDLPREPFHKDDVIQHWKRIAHHFRTNDQEQVFMVMTKRDPVQIDERTFQFETDNSIQATRIESVMEEIMAYLRKEVKNYDLNIKVEIAQQSEDETKYLTGKDKFDRLARINTNLLDLKNRFNLDIEP